MKRTVYIGARIDRDVNARLEAIAKQQERPKSQLIRWILKHYAKNPSLLKGAAGDFF